MHEDNIRLLRIKDVMSKVGLSKPTIYSKIREGCFPRQVVLGPKTVAWVESEINE
ncbi:MAG: helix-turn-helix transcriptional regulator [Shewanella sp.]